MQVLVEEGDLVGHHPLEGVVDIDRECPSGYTLTSPRGALAAWRKVAAAGATESDSQTQNRIGQGIFLALRPGL